MDNEKTMNWAILGTGVVSRKFAYGLRHLGTAAQLVSVASRNPNNARAFAVDFGAAHTAATYEEAVTHPDIDAVYIATPPSEHEAHALLAIAAGKAVLVEKPFALDASAARRIVEAARDAGVFCMEAMWTRFLPVFPKLNLHLKNGKLGEIRSFHASFMGSDLPNADVSLFDPARGGGALMHRGIYPVSLARHLLGPITDVMATARMGETGVDEDCTLVLRHGTGALSTVSASLRAQGPNSLVISGTHGMITLAAPIFRPHRASVVYTSPRKAQKQTHGRFEALRESTLAQKVNQILPAGLRGAFGGETIRMPYAGNGYHYEAAEVALCLQQGKTHSMLMPVEESIEIMGIIDSARAQFT